MACQLPPPRQGPSLAPAAPLVRTCGDVRTLEFLPGEVQSAMRLSRPSALLLDYARAMMCFALFVPHPRHILMVGLGGGSLAKFCYRCFPHARITVLELRADVIALREQFGVPPDDARFTVVRADAAPYLAHVAGVAGARARVDVLLVDGFTAAGLPPALGSARFYADCRRVLSPGGVLVANMFSYDAQYAAMLGRLNWIFGSHVCRLDKVAGNNCILFAVRAPARAEQTHTPERRAHACTIVQLLARRHGTGIGLLNRLLVRAVLAYLALHTRDAP